MKLLKVAFAVAVAALVGPAYAFHEGGVATCESCHTMHNSSAKETGALGPQMTNNDLGVGITNPYLLQGQDASSTCLACHSGTGASSYRVLDRNTWSGAPNLNTLNFTPGGDFAWLQVGPRKGHNVFAADYASVNNAAETRKAPPGAATGATWDGTGFSCVSCHDPHGQTRLLADGTQGTPTRAANGEVTGFTGMAPIAESGSYGGAAFAEFHTGPDGNNATAGAYRILGGLGWKPRTAPAQPAMAANPPLALAPSTYNKSESGFALSTTGAHTGQTVVAYLSGMSEWCSSCHPKMHGEAASGTLANTLDKHPSGATATLGAGLSANYNKYVRTGQLNGTNAYDALIPVELNVARNAAAAALSADITGTTTIAATATSSVMCLSCHRAHASGFDFMMRWDPTYEFNDIGSATALTAGYVPNVVLTVGYQARAATQAWPQYGVYQRDLCNKCHIKD